MRNRDDMQAFGRLVLETIATEAVLFLGDITGGFNVVREALGRRLGQLDRAEREAVAGTLGISRRRIDDWIKQAREADAARDGREQSFRENTRAGRIYFAAWSYLQQAGDDYRSLGSIGDHIKAELGERVSTIDIWRQLEAYVRLSILERHPEDPEMFRLKVKHTRWQVDESEREFVEQLVGYMLPEVFSLSYQTFVGSPGSLARLLVYAIPESEVEAFTRKQVKLMRGVKAELDAEEEELQRKHPDEKLVYVRDIHLAGRGDRDALVDAMERYNKKGRRSGNDETQNDSQPDSGGGAPGVTRDGQREFPQGDVHPRSPGQSAAGAEHGGAADPVSGAGAEDDPGAPEEHPSAG